MVYRSVIQRVITFLAVFLVYLLFAGCGMMSVLVDDEDAAEGALVPVSVVDASLEGCGNGIIEGRFGEACDRDDVGGATCNSLGKGSGTLRCDNARCQFDFSLCSTSDASFNEAGVSGEGDASLPEGGTII
jgi:hypothetical protein